MDFSKFADRRSSRRQVTEKLTFQAQRLGGAQSVNTRLQYFARSALDPLCQHLKVNPRSIHQFIGRTSTTVTNGPPLFAETAATPMIERYLSIPKPPNSTTLAVVEHKMPTSGQQ